MLRDVDVLLAPLLRRATPNRLECESREMHDQHFGTVVDFANAPPLLAAAVHRHPLVNTLSRARNQERFR